MSRTVPAPPHRDRIPNAGKGRPEAIDVAIGQNIRAHRLRQRVTQVTLAKLLGLTFQQIQKYENGANRVAAGRLAEIAFVLGLPITALYEGVADARPGRLAPPPITDALALRAAEQMQAISDRSLCRMLVSLIERVAASERKRDDASPQHGHSSRLSPH